MLKKRVTGFKAAKYSLKGAKKSQLTYVQKSMPAEIWDSFCEVCILRRVEDHLESVCEELQLLKALVFPMSGEFSMNNHFTHITMSASCHSS
jgi:hypothetical protein